MSLECSDGPVYDELASILNERLFEDAMCRRLEKENIELKLIIECLRSRIDRSSSFLYACRRPDLQEQYNVLAMRNRALREQLVLIRSELDEIELKYSETRDSCRFLKVVQQSLGRKVMYILIELNNTIRELTMDEQYTERKNISDEIKYMQSLKKRSSKQIQELNKENVDLINENIELRERLCEIEQKKNQGPLSVFKRIAMHGGEEVVSILLERCGYAPDSADSCGVTPFMDAVRNGHLSVARLLIEKHQASPLAADVLGAQPVHQVAVTGQEEALRFLVLDLAVDVNQRATDIQLTALHYAAKEGHTAVIKTLVELGADLHARDKKGRTALHMACIGQHAEAVRTLLLLGLQDSQDGSGSTARQLAKKQNVLRMFERGTPEAHTGSS